MTGLKNKSSITVNLISLHFGLSINIRKVDNFN